MPTMPDSKPARPQGAPLAAIDMGSNSFRLEIGALQHGPLPAHRLPEGDRAPGRRARRRRPADRRGRRARLACLRRFARGWPASHPRRCARWPRRPCARRATATAFLLRAQEALGFPDRGHLGPRGSPPDLRRRGHLQPADEPPPGGRHRRPLDRADPRQRPRAVVAESFARRLGQPVDALLRRRPLQRRAFRAAQVAAGAELEEALQTFAPMHVAGGAGLVAARRCGVAAAAGQRPQRRPHHARRPALVHRALHRRRSRRPLDLPSLKADRAVIAGGLAILYTLAAHFGIRELCRPRARCARA
jgi:exopolyphosphatase/guanosine-5'-triphosphate,3'-diphosphate pyrophosphatase